MNKILETTKYVINNSKNVKINLDLIPEVSSKFNARDISFWLDETPFQAPDLSEENKLNFMFTMNALNFCYWGDPKWTVDYQGQQLDGAWAMIASLHRALEEDRPIFNASYLENITEKEVLKVLHGTPQIPLFQERADILREVGAVLNKKYKGKFINMVESASQDALKLLDLITEDFPSYYDSADYEGTEVVFHKRAQLAIADLYRDFNGQGHGSFRNVDKLTAFADYKIPQTLRKLGVLQYSSDLAHKIDSKEEIVAGSKEEIEIRAGQVWAVEHLKESLRSRIPGVKSMDLDSYLWLQGQKVSSDDKPYHRTKTIYY